MSGREKTETGGNKKTAAEKAEEITSAQVQDSSKISSHIHYFRSRAEEG